MFISRCTDDPIILILTIFPAKIGVTKKPLIFKQAKFLEPVLCGAKRYKMAKCSFGQDLALLAKSVAFERKSRFGWDQDTCVLSYLADIQRDIWAKRYPP